MIDGHIEYIGNAFPLEAHLERLMIVALAVACLTGHIHVGQEVHLNGLVTIALAHLAPTTTHIKAETSWLVATDLGFRQIDKERTYVGEYARIGGRIGARRTS